MLTLEQVKGFLLPELQKINNEQQFIRERLTSIEQHLLDQSRRIDEINNRIDETNHRIDRLYEVVVRRDEHDALINRIVYLEQTVQDIKLRLAA